MKMNRKVVRSVICVLLALIFVISLMTALIPTNASAASQSEINQLTQQRKELQAKQKEQQKTINSLRSKKASVVDQKAALDKENDLAQQEIELVKEHGLRPADRGQGRRARGRQAGRRGPDGPLPQLRAPP